MKKIKTFLPWNLQEYFAANGFHELYDALLEDNKIFNFKVIDIGRIIKKKRPNFIKVFWFLHREFGANIYRFFRNSNIDFFHTYPIYRSNKPFVLHLEDFNSLFLPKDVTKILPDSFDYKTLLESKNCLAIISHIPETLESFRGYFKSDIINSKLHFYRIGLSKGMMEDIDQLPKLEKKQNEYTFLFTCSKHQNINNVRYRGILISLIFAKRFLDDGRQGIFIFKSPKLPKEELFGLGFNNEFVDFIYSHPKIVWYENEISNMEMNILLKKADFFLLPSCQLHSMSILKSMYSETIPIVTDTVGTNQYVEHLKNGVILNGVKDLVFLNKEIPMFEPNRDNFIKIEKGLADELYKEVVNVISNSDKFESLKKHAKDTVKDRFNGNRNFEEMSEKVYDLYNKSNFKNLSLYRFFEKTISWIFRIKFTKDFDQYKEAIVPNLICKWDNYFIIKLHDNYYKFLINNGKHPNTMNLKNYSNPVKNLEMLNAK